jgi:hypothetical protein
VRPVRYRGLQLGNTLRVGQSPARPHKPGPPGATPGPATTGYANWKSGEVESLVTLQVRLLSRSLNDPVVQWQRRLGDNQESAGSIPAGITRWSVGVLAAHLLGKEEDRVRVPDGPLELVGWHVPWRRLIPARSVRWVRFPSGTLQRHRAHGPTGRHQNGILEIGVQLPVGPLYYGR